MVQSYYSGMEQTPFIFGFILQSSMIMALGAQNLFVLEKGLTKDRAYLVAAICSICDMSLIFLGVLGAGAFFSQNEVLTMILKIAGAAFLFKYAYDKFREAGATMALGTPSPKTTKTLKEVILSTLAVSLLNPHVYLDTVVLIGGYSTKFADHSEKIQFAFGAGLFSAIWFFTVSLGAGYLSGALKEERTMRKVNYATSFMMAYLGANLILSAA